MRDAGREGPDRDHPVREHEALLHLTFGAHVARHDRDARSTVEFDPHGTALHPHGRTVLGAQAHLGGRLTLAPAKAGEPRLDHRSLLLDGDIASVAAQDVMWQSNPAHSQPGRVRVDDLLVAQDEDAERNVLDEGPEALLGPVERLLGTVARGDVADDERNRRLAIELDVRDRMLGPERAPIAVDEPPRPYARRQARAFSTQPEHFLTLVGMDQVDRALPDQVLGARMAKKREGGGIHVLDHPPLLDQHCVRQSFDYTAQVALGSFALANHVRDSLRSRASLGDSPCTHPRSDGHEE